jgi:guanine nucleotide-binding protein G(i) subunit alpha
VKILHHKGFTPDEVRNYMEIILKNILDSIKSIVSAMDELENATYATAEAEQLGKKILTYPEDYLVEEKDAPEFQTVWRDTGVQDVVMKRQREFHFLDSAPWFLENCTTILAPGYEPKNDSILRCRLATTGIHSTKFTMDGSTFTMFDVGGQRGERIKWIHCFEEVTAILFIASLVEYDQVLAEDRDKNRLVESLDLFKGIINLPFLKNAAVILFLNKDDLFEQKIKRVAISRFFPEYLANNSSSGGNKDHDYKQGIKFIRDLYLKRNDDAGRPIYVQTTNATNTDNIEFVWKCTKHLILEKNIAESGLGC